MGLLINDTRVMKAYIKQMRAMKVWRKAAQFFSLIALLSLSHYGQTHQGETHDVKRQMLNILALPEFEKAYLTTLTVELQPEVRVGSHTHEGMLYVYVLQGRVRSKLKGSEAKDYKQGDVWVEPLGSVHELTENLSHNEVAKILVLSIGEKGTSLSTSIK